EMVVEQSQHIEESSLDLRRGYCVRADEPHPVHHAGPNLAGEGCMLLFAGVGTAHARDAPRRADLVDVACPTVVEHPLAAPLGADYAIAVRHGSSSDSGFLTVYRLPCLENDLYHSMRHVRDNSELSAKIAIGAERTRVANAPARQARRCDHVS